MRLNTRLITKNLLHSTVAVGLGFLLLAQAQAQLIRYDNGVSNALPTVSSHMYGNRFNTVSGMALPTGGTLTMASFYLNSIGGAAAFVSVADQLNTGAGTAMNIISNNYAGLMAPGFNVVTFAPPLNFVGNSFLAGVWYFGSDVPGLGTGTTMGQGFHGMHMNDGGTTLTGFVPLTNQNALFRVNGSGLPVELLHFKVE